MNKKLILIITLLLIFPLIIAACGGDDEDEDKNDEDKGVTASQVEDALVKLFEGDGGPMKEISCDADHAQIDAIVSGMEEVEGMTMTATCEGEGLIKCTMETSMTMEDETFTDTSEAEFTVEDGKICGGFGAEAPVEEAPVEEATAEAESGS